MNIINTKKIVFATCCLLFIGLLAGAVIASGQMENATSTATSGTATTNPTPSLTETSDVSTGNQIVPPSPLSLSGLLVIFVTIVLIVLIPIAIFAWYNKKTLENVLEANQKFGPEKGKPQEPTYLFSWENIPGSDSGKLIDFLKQSYSIDWVKKENIKNDGTTISASDGENHLKLRLNDDKTKVNLEISDGRKDELIAKMDNGKLNIYEPAKPGEPDDKREPVTTLIKALIPPEPLGMPNGSVRAIVAIIGIGIFAYAVFNFQDYRKELVAALIALVSSVTGFYFGARSTEEVRKPEKTPEEKPPTTPTPPSQ